MFWVDESPVFVTPKQNEISVAEGNVEVVSLNAIDFHGNEIHSFLLSGSDKDFFIIENKNLQFKNLIDFENDQINYSVDVVALDDFGNSETKSLKITINAGKKLCFF